MKIVITSFLLIIVISTGIALSIDSPNPHGPMDIDCTVCHTTSSWHQLRDSIDFDHTKTGFRLDGAHKSASCAVCHKNPVFSHIGTSCIDCHSDHHLGQLGINCAECHIPRDWQPQTDNFLVHAERGFPLTGIHAVADCEACHVNSDRMEFSGTPTDCESCHRKDIARADDPDHELLAFNYSCDRCHHAAFGSWTRTSYVHSGAFLLTGAHQTINCSACHADGFSGTLDQCIDCHNAEYTNTTNPNHFQADFAVTCDDCHSTIAWLPATYNHAVNGFALLGRHSVLTCVTCHQSTYVGTPSQCIACHETEYLSTSEPDHTAAYFSTECESCHTAYGWLPANWDHDGPYFPIYSGAHNEEWSSCSECHTNPADFNDFECIYCHKHNRTDTDDDHSKVDNYEYLSLECYNCHPRGSHD